MRLYKLEAMRGFAAFYVVLHHTMPPELLEFGALNLKFLLRFGQEAVILFFILSGFVIHYSHQRSVDKSFASYFTKRALRIYVPLIIVFFLAYLIESHNAGRFIDPMLYNLGQNLLMLQDWDKVKPNVIAEPYMNNTPLWSLSYEWWFYMLYFPITKFLATDSTKHSLVFATTIVATLIYTVYPHFIPRLISYFGIWWAGVYLASLFLQNEKLTLRSASLPIGSLIIISAILMIKVAIYYNYDKQLLLGFHPILEARHTIFALIVIVGALVWKNYNWFGFDILFKPFLFLAPISYTIYISHLPIMEHSNFLIEIENDVTRWIMYLAIMLTFSYIVEQILYPKIRFLFSAS